MRIVAGAFRGRAIDAPPGNATRPTVDRVREALFSSLFSLRGGFEGAVVLDAFAGSGALGLEALSRGAQCAAFYERDARAVDVVRRNVGACGIEGARAQVVRRDVMQVPPVGHVPPFDLVFLDPPYDYDAAGVFAMVASLKDAGSLSEGAIVVYEHALKSADVVERAASSEGFSLVKFKKYGKTGVSTFVGE